MSRLLCFDKVSVTVSDKQLLSKVSFSLRSGQKTVICGASGSGKSSILKTVLGMYPLSEGMVYVQNQPLNPQSVQKIRSLTSYIAQEPILGADRVRDALLLPFQFKAYRQHPPSEIQIQQVFQRLNLPLDLLNRDCNRVSGGEKQRIALARGMLLGKTLYLLDEVTSALDTESKQAVLAAFADPVLTVLAVAHDPDWLQSAATVYEMQAGQLSTLRNA